MRASAADGEDDDNGATPGEKPIKQRLIRPRAIRASMGRRAHPRREREESDRIAKLHKKASAAAASASSAPFSAGRILRVRDLLLLLLAARVAKKTVCCCSLWLFHGHETILWRPRSVLSYILVDTRSSLDQTGNRPTKTPTNHAMA